MKTSGYLAIVFTLLAIVAVPATLIIANKNKESSVEISQASGTGEVAIFTTPETLHVSRGDNFSIDLKIDSGKVVIGEANITLNFDPQYLRYSGNIIKQSAFTTLNADTSEGEVMVNGMGAVIGNGTIVSIPFSAIRTGQTTVSISPSSQVFAKKSAQSIKFNSSPSSIIIE